MGIVHSFRLHPAATLMTLHRQGPPILAGSTSGVGPGARGGSRKPTRTCQRGFHASKAALPRIEQVGVSREGPPIA